MWSTWASIKQQMGQMASKTSEAAGKLGDVVAPRHSHIAAFRLHWKAVDSFFTEIARHAQLDDPNIIRDRGIDRHLAKIIELMCEEETAANAAELEAADSRSADGGGQSCATFKTECFEAFCDERILDHLCAAAIQNRPPGMVLYALKFMFDLFEKLHTQPLLELEQIRLPVHNFLTNCIHQELINIRSADEVEFYFLSCLRTITRRLTKQPLLLPSFLEFDSPDEARRGREPGGGDEAGVALDCVPDRFVILSALTPFLTLDVVPRHQFQHGKQDIVDRLNEHLGRPVVRQVRIL